MGGSIEGIAGLLVEGEGEIDLASSVLHVCDEMLMALVSEGFFKLSFVCHLSCRMDILFGE